MKTVKLKKIIKPFGIIVAIGIILIVIIDKFIMPAYPATEVKDPTGAGDSFAGAMMGYLAKVGRTDFAALKTAIAYGNVAASFTISDFSVNGLTAISINDIESRLENLKKLTQF